MARVVEAAFGVAGLALSGASGNSGPIDCRSYPSIAVDVDVTVLAADTIAFTVDRQGADGGWYPIYSPSALSAIGKISRSIGRGYETSTIPGSVIRLAWVMTGATKTATASLSVLGVRE